MARFRFRLEPMVRLREFEEGERRSALAVIQREAAVLEDRIRVLQQRMDEARRSLQTGLVGAVDGHLIRGHAAQSIALDNQARRLALELAEVYRRRDVAQAALLEAIMRRKTLERLREIRFEAWKGDLVKREGRELDDVVNGRGARVAEHENR